MRTRTSMAASLRSLPRELFLQPCGDPRRHVLADVPPEGGELLHPARAEETVLGAGHQVERVDVGRLLAVELVHLELVLEVRDRAQPLDDPPRAPAPRAARAQRA